MNGEQAPDRSVVTPDDSQPLPGPTGGRYAVLRSLGRGAAAHVFLARDRLLNREVAVKVLTQEAAADPAFVERFRREAQAIASFNHPNIVTVYDWGEAGDTYSMVMEYVRGGTLGNLLADKGPLQEEEALLIAEGVCVGLAAAHARQIVHRDIKPDNILLTEDGHPKVADFGIAWAQGLSSLTATNAIAGTISYISPEQARGAPVDGRSDLYSLGVVLYRVLTGELPFRGSSMVDVAMKHVQDAPLPPRQLRPELSPQTERVVLRALAKRPEDRYDSADDMGHALREARMALTPQIAPGRDPNQHSEGPTAVSGELVREEVRISATRAPRVEHGKRSRNPGWALGLPLLLLGLAAVVFAARPWQSAHRTLSGVASGPHPTVGPRGSSGPDTSTGASGGASSSTAPTRVATSSPSVTNQLNPGANPSAQSATGASSGMPSTTATPSTGATSRRPAAGPDDAVVQFYTAAAEHRFGDAAALWSPSMLKTWGRKDGIEKRFADTRSIYVQIGKTSVDPASGTATVAVQVTEQTKGGVQQFAGTWQLVQSNGRWLLNAPHLQGVSPSSQQSITALSGLSVGTVQTRGDTTDAGESEGPPHKADKGHGRGKGKDHGRG